jgi:hypothetical protein
MDASKPTTVVAAAWFRPEDYQRIREIADDEMPATFDEFETKMSTMIDGITAKGVVCRKMLIDPDELLAFARASGAKIDTKTRSQFAIFLLMQENNRPNG